MPERMYGWRDDDVIVKSTTLNGEFGKETYRIGRNVYYVDTYGRTGVAVIAKIRLKKDTKSPTFFCESGAEGRIKSLPLNTEFVYDTKKKLNLHLEKYQKK